MKRHPITDALIAETQNLRVSRDVGIRARNERIIAVYLSGLSLVDAGKTEGISKSTVQYILSCNGVPPHPAGQNLKKGADRKPRVRGIPQSKAHRAKLQEAAAKRAAQGIGMEQFLACANRGVNSQYHRDQIAEGIRRHWATKRAADYKHQPAELPSNVMEALVADYAGGISIQKIATKFRMGKATVHMRLAEAGVVLRSSGGQKIARTPKPPVAKVAIVVPVEGEVEVAVERAPKVAHVRLKTIAEHPALREVVRCLSCREPFAKHWRSTVKCEPCFRGRRS